jgi:tetratricopeptide (TPR) repeat protein
LIHALVGVSAMAWCEDPKPLVRWDAAVGRIEKPLDHPFALARIYASGRRAEAIAQLEGWGENDLKQSLVAIRALRNRIGHLSDKDLEAAVMLHTDRDLFERFQPDVVESRRNCGINRHAGYGRSLVSLLMVESDASREFGRRWLVAMALQSHWDLCLDDVRGWTQEGLKWFPRNPELLLIRATAREISAALTPEPNLYLDPNDRSRGLTDIARRRQDLAEAKRDLETALAIDPDLHEARLRLGRVLWRLERPAQARPVLDAVVQRTQDPRLLYLAHLFLGRLDESDGGAAAAIAHYSAARARDPTSQAAAVALSHALIVGGDDAEGRAVLAQAVDQAPRANRNDAFMTYHLGRAPFAEGMLETLREDTLQ